jgi:carbamoyl-phosphate synthase large subunit
VPCESVLKISEGRPNPADLLKNGEITMMMMTSSGDEPELRDSKAIRRLALGLNVPIVTTIAGARATAMALRTMKDAPLALTPLQDYFPDYKDESLALMLA